MFGKDFDKVISVILILAAVGVVCGLWKLVEIIVWIVKHVHIGIS